MQPEEEHSMATWTDPGLRRGDGMRGAVSHQAQLEKRLGAGGVSARRYHRWRHAPDVIPSKGGRSVQVNAKSRSRTFCDISDGIRDLMTAFSPNACANYLGNSGYVSV